MQRGRGAEGKERLTAALLPSDRIFKIRSLVLSTPEGDGAWEIEPMPHLLCAMP
ncbi:MAG: hypothetical protein V7L21_34560 [Nostoc sp.]|nr:hypothetical protein [Nostoc sp. NMS9]